jgi:hypothetical protein
MMTPTHRARFRFRLQTKLHIDKPEYRFTVEGREVVLSAETGETQIKQSEWLVMNAKGFNSEEDARAFANRLKTAAEISSAATRLGIDAGRDLATSGLAPQACKSLLDSSQVAIRDNIHGVDTFLDEPNVRIFNSRGALTVTKNPDAFISSLQTFSSIPGAISQHTRDVVLLLNYALMGPEPVAQIVFSISAVEMLGQQEQWTESQRQMLRDLATSVKSSSVGTEAERIEVAIAIERSHKLSLRQGVIRLLKSLGLESLRNEWDEIYSERSALIHGLAPRPGADYSQLRSRTLSLCGRILLAFVAREIPSANAHVDEFYKLP